MPVVASSTKNLTRWVAPLVVIIVGFIAPFEASATWTTPSSTGTPDIVGYDYTGGLALSVDAAGNATAFGASTQIYGRTLSSLSHVWSDRRTVQPWDEGRSFTNLQSAENSSGDIIVAWQNSNFVTAAIYRASVDVWSTQSFYDANESSGEVRGVAIDASGNAFVAWRSIQQGSGMRRGHVRRYSRVNNVWGATTDLRQTSEFYGDIAIIGTSDALLVTSREAGGTLMEVAWQRYSATTDTWSTSQDIATPGTRQLALAGNASGNAVLAWRAGTDIFATFYAGTTDTWSVPAVIATPGIGPSTPSVTFATDGSATAVWIDSSNSIIQGAVYKAATGWTVSDLSPAGSVTELVSAGNINGDVVVAWSRRISPFTTFVRRFSVITDGWGPSSEIAGPGNNYTPQAAVATNGAATVVFYSATGGSDRGVYSAQELPPTVFGFARVTASPSNASSLQFTITFSESVSGLTTSDFSVGGGASGWSVTGLTGSGAGPYTVTVDGSAGTDGTVSLALAAYAVVGSGMLAPTDTQTSQTITVDRVVPAAPTLGTTPSSSTNSTSASVTITGAEAGGTFQCKLDSGSYAVCTSPYTTSGLGDGSHTLYVRQVDAALNNGTPITTTWTVDTAVPLAPGLSGAPTGSTSLTSASITITPAEGGGTLKCKLDAGTYTTCTSPVVLSSLSNDSHTFWARQDDAAGNIGVASSTTWTVDTIEPEAPTLGGAPTGSTSATSVSITFTGAESGGTFSCKLDALSWNTCTSPFTANPLDEGPHTLQVRQIDTATNLGTIASATWTIDTTGPNAPTLGNLPAASTALNSLAITITGAEVGGTFQCKVDSEAYATCTSPYRRSSLSDASHTVTIRQVDAAGNTGTPVAYTWTIVHLTLSVPSQPTGVDATATGTTTATVTFTEPDDTGGSAISAYAVRCTSSTGGGTRSTTTSSLVANMTDLSSGHTYTCTVSATNDTGTGTPSVASSPFTLTRPTVPATPGTTDSPAGTTPTPAAINPITNLKASIVSATSIKLAYTVTTPGATHSATCTATGGKAGTGKSTTGSLPVKSLTYGKSYMCDVIASVGTTASATTSIRVTLLTDLPTPASLKLPKTAQTGSSIKVSWLANAKDKWAVITQTAQLRTATGAIISTVAPRNRTSQTATLKIPSNTASGSYSLCVVLQDAKAATNSEQTCRKIRIVRPSSTGGGGSSGGNNNPKPAGPIVI